MAEKYLKLNPVKFGLSAGIVGAIIAFLTTITGILGLSAAANFMASNVWSNLGYSISWTGAFIGAALGFVYGFIIIYVSASIYNKLI